MRPENFQYLLRSLDRIDRGGQVPRLSGLIGSFLRHYGSCRNDFAKLALQQGIETNLRGEIPGYKIGVVSLIPLTALVAPQWASTNFGGFFSVPVLCPELLCVIDLRLWANSGSGSSGISILESLMSGETGLTLDGGYRWMPPIRITPGVGKFDVLRATSQELWSKVCFLKYTGEDITSDPYPLEYRPFSLDDEPRLVATRVSAGIIRQGHFVEVPCATSSNSEMLQLKTASFTTGRAVGLLSREGIVTCLLTREPADEFWTLWDAIESEANDLLTHLVSWAEYVDGLRESPVWGSRANIIETVRASLLQFNIEPSAEVDLPYPIFSTYSFARSLASRIRFSSGIGLGQVGPIP